MNDYEPPFDPNINPPDEGQSITYSLGPRAFPEVSQQRVQNLMQLPIFQLKATIRALTDLENGEEVELPEEFEGTEGEERLHKAFISLLEGVEDTNGSLTTAAIGFGSLERFTDIEAVGNLHKAIFDKLVQSGWSKNEVICTDLIACGYFDVTDLDTL